MKNLRSYKIIVTLLVLLLSLSAVGIAIAASSAESEKSLEIVSNNISNKGKIAIMYAVDAKGFTDDEQIKFTVWDSDPRAGSAKAISSLTKLAGDTDTIKIGGTNYDYLIFTAPGVPSKNMCNSYYVEVSSGNISSGIYEYSILEYLFERLYTCTNTESQVKFYEYLLGYGEASQVLFDYNTTALPSHYRYVNVTDGALSDGRQAGTYKTGSSVTLTYTEEIPSGYGVSWEIFDENGNRTVADDKSTVMVTNHMICKPLLTKSPVIADFESVGSTSQFTFPTGFSGTHSQLYYVQENGNWVLETDMDKTSTSLGSQFTINPSTLNGYNTGSFGRYVFSADLKWDLTVSDINTAEMDEVGALILSSKGGYAYLAYVYIYYTPSDIAGTEGTYELEIKTTASSVTVNGINYKLGASVTLIPKTKITNNTWYNLKLTFDRAESDVTISGTAATGTNPSLASAYLTDASGNLLAQKENVGYYHNLYYTGIDDSALTANWRTSYRRGTNGYGANYTYKMQMDNVMYYGEEKSSHTAEVLSAKGGASGIVTLIHDDGYINSARAIDALFEQYSLKGDIAMVLNKVYDSSTGKEKAVINDFRELIATGRWDITSHSATHTWWGIAEESTITTDDGETLTVYTLSDNTDKMNAEIVGAQEKLRELFPGQRVLTFAYPGFTTEKNAYKEITVTVGGEAVTVLVARNSSDPLNSGDYNKKYIFRESALSLIEDTYISARSGGSQSIGLGDSTVDWNWVDAYSFGGGNLASIKSAVTDAATNGKYAVIYTHNLTGTGDTNNLADAAKMAELCEYVSGYVKSGEIWNAFYEEAVMYIREAQTASVSASGSANHITVTLTDEMDDAIYNEALTVRVEVPESWSSVKVTQNGNTSYVNARSVDGKWIVDIDIVPDAGDATLLPL